MVDFNATWFSKFLAPDCVTKDQVERLQVTCSPEVFLQSFNIVDDTELEFMVVLKDRDEGHLKVMKTRDLFIVEANVWFKIDQEITCDESYVFPDDQLLLKGEVK